MVWGRRKRARDKERAVGAAMAVAKGGGRGLRFLIGIKYL